MPEHKAEAVAPDTGAGEGKSAMGGATQIGAFEATASADARSLTGSAASDTPDTPDTLDISGTSGLCAASAVGEATDNVRSDPVDKPTPQGCVTFDYDGWSQRYPAVADVTTSAAAEAYFDIATQLFLNNSSASIVRDTACRAHLLDLLVAHLAWLMRPEEDNGPGPAVAGPVTEARQGSISVRYDVSGQAPSASWFMQSQYGAMYWRATAFWRGMRFVSSQAPRPRYWP